MTNPPPQIGKDMSESAVESVLASHHTGVVSLGVGNKGFGFPISYTYDQENRRLLLGLVTPSESKKREFASGTEEATFTVYTYEDADSWQSVTVTGPIRHIDGDDPALHVPGLFFRHVTDDSGEGRMVDLDEFDRTWYELQIETLSGRHSDP